MNNKLPRAWVQGQKPGDQPHIDLADTDKQDHSVMLATSFLGRQIHRQIAAGEFTEARGTNEVRHAPTGVCYGRTTFGRIYRRDGQRFAMLNAETQAFEDLLRLRPGEAPDWSRKFTLSQLAPWRQNALQRPVFVLERALTAP